MTSPLEQKKKNIAGPSIVTANRTWDGAVIYRTVARIGRPTSPTPPSFVPPTTPALCSPKSVADDLGAIGRLYCAGRRSEDGTVEPGNLREQSAPPA